MEDMAAPSWTPAEQTVLQLWKVPTVDRGVTNCSGSVWEVEPTVQAQRKGLANTTLDNEQCTQRHRHCSLLHSPASPA